MVVSSKPALFYNHRKKNCSFWPWFALNKTKWGIIFIEDLTNIMSAKLSFIGPVVSEEMIKIWNAKDLINDDKQQTQSDDKCSLGLWSKILTF